MNRNYLLILLLSSLFSFFGCTKDVGDDNIEAYIKKKGLVVQKSPEGISYIIEVSGNQLKKPRINSDVRVKYNGRLLNDKEFDSSTNFRTNLSNVIAGWRRGMILFGEGGKGTLIIPSSLGYGDQAQGDIPASSALVFDIELLEVIN